MLQATRKVQKACLLICLWRIWVQNNNCSACSFFSWFVCVWRIMEVRPSSFYYKWKKYLWCTYPIAYSRKLCCSVRTIASCLCQMCLQGIMVPSCFITFNWIFVVMTRIPCRCISQRKVVIERQSIYDVVQKRCIWDFSNFVFISPAINWTLEEQNKCSKRGRCHSVL